MNKKQEIGSSIAKHGFQNEKEIALKFNAWKEDSDAQEWLKIMGYDLLIIEYVKANVISGYKADLNVVIQIKLKKIQDTENIQVKLVSNLSGYNQIDKRWLKSYKEMWNIPDNVYNLLQYFTGELLPYKQNTKDTRRMFITEFSKDEQDILINWLNENKILIVNDIIKGRGILSAEWYLVINKAHENIKWVLKNVNVVIQHYLGDGKIQISPRGSIYIGNITVQRKGGDGGRPTANMLQFKINPAELFSC